MIDKRYYVVSRRYFACVWRPTVVVRQEHDIRPLDFIQPDVAVYAPFVLTAPVGDFAPELGKRPVTIGNVVRDMVEIPHLPGAQADQRLFAEGYPVGFDTPAVYPGGAIFL